MNTDTPEQQSASVVRSVRNFRRALQICKERIDADALNTLRATANRAELSEWFASIVSGLK